MSDFETVRRWLLGGFSLKRAFPQEPKPFSSLPVAAALSAGSEEQEKQGFSGGKRRVKTSAAMLGLALSMGASGALLPSHDDAAAAEPPSPNLALATVPLGLHAASLPISDAVPEVAQPMPQLTAYHTVEAGQTLWQIASIHRVDIQDIKAANGIQSDTILQVGQVLRVPTDLALSSDNSTWAASAAPNGSVAETANNFSPPAQQTTASDARSQDPSEIDLDFSLSASEPSPAGVVQNQVDSNFRIQSGISEFETTLSTDRVSSAGLNPEQLPSELEATYPQTDNVTDEVWLTWSLDSRTSFSDLAENLARVSLQGDIASQGQLLRENLSESANQINSAPLGGSSNSLEASNPTGGLPSDQVVAASGETFQAPLSSPGRLDDLRASASQSPKFSIQAPAEENYQIRQGDTLADIADAHGISVGDLAGTNGIKDPNFIVAGEALTIPDLSSTVQLESRPELAEPTLVASVGSSVFQSPSQPLSPSLRLARLQETVIDRGDNLSQLVNELRPTSSGSADSAVALLPQESLISPREGASVASSMSVSAEGAGLTGEIASSGDSQLDPYMANLLDGVRAIHDSDRLQVSSSSPVESSGVVSADLPQTQSGLGEEIALVSSSMPEAVPVNPEFSSRGGLAPGQALAANSAGSSLEFRDSQLLAAAPLGSESYAPLNPSSIQRVVSPDMPVLPGRDQYLPDAPNIFNGYSWPTTGIITSGYGYRWGRMHRGVDIAGPVGTPIVAAAAGVVESAGWNSGGYGNLVDIRHADGSMTRYAHNSRLLVHPGQQIAQGQQIAEMGSTGYSTGPHLHFEVHLPGQGTVNPIAYLPSR